LNSNPETRIFFNNILRELSKNIFGEVHDLNKIDFTNIDNYDQLFLEQKNKI
jgi:hypothetical protein